MKLSIIIPVYNEEQTIKQVLNAVTSVNLSCQKEIIIVDDGSTDETGSQISKFKSQNQSLKLKIIHHETNQGKGAAIRQGINKATGDYILIQDADLEYNPEEIPKLLTPILSKPTTSIAVYGSRFANGRPVIPLLYYLGNIFLTKLTNLLYGSKLTDMETGYKLLPTSFLKTAVLSGNRFEIEPEITVKLIRNKIPILEVPISYQGRTHLTGKKLTIRDAVEALKTLFYYKYNSHFG